MNDPSIRVLVADDSELFAEGISDALQSDPSITVVGVAKNGREAISLTEELRPDLVTMDVHMPEMGGLEAIEYIMATRPTPILVLTADDRTDALTFDALRLGALDLVAKPVLYPRRHRIERELCERVKLLASVKVVRHMTRRSLKERASRHPLSHTELATGHIIGLVASTGGPAALSTVLHELPASLPAPILVVQHIATGFHAGLATWLNETSPLDVRMARHGDLATPGVVHVAPAAHHLTISTAGRLLLDTEDPVGGHRPSGTRLLASLAKVYGRRAVGAVLTGMGRDGVEGLQAIHEAGGRTLAQDQPSSAVYGMPRWAWETGAAERQVPIDKLAQALVGALTRRRPREKP